MACVPCPSMDASSRAKGIGQQYCHDTQQAVSTAFARTLLGKCNGDAQLRICRMRICAVCIPWIGTLPKLTNNQHTIDRKF